MAGFRNHREWSDADDASAINGYGYTEDDMASYARAAVEADRAQRVPDGWKQEAAEAIDWLLNNIRRDAPQLSGKAMGNAVRVRDALLASTPAPAQQETSEGCDPHWSYYFRVTECKAKTSRDGDCICWHTEGTGPFDMVRHDDADQFLEWRESPSAAPAPAQQEPSEAEMVCAEAYQVVGCLLSDLGLFETEAARKILDNLSEARMVHQDVLPWESAACAERDARIAELEKDCDRFERYWNEAMATHKNIAELERQLEEARKDADAFTDEQLEAAVKAWFQEKIVPGKFPFHKRMRAAIAAAIKEQT